MVFNLSTVVNLKAIPARKQAQVDRDNLRENAKRVSHDYAIGDQVYVKIDGIKRKLNNKKRGPYRITQICTNGTVQIQKGKVNERINICRFPASLHLSILDSPTPNFNFSFNSLSPRTFLNWSSHCSTKTWSWCISISIVYICP